MNQHLKSLLDQNLLMLKQTSEREKLRQKVELLRSFERLKNNTEFKKVILQGFCEQEVIDLVRAANLDPSSEGRQHKSQQAQAGAVLEAYFIKLINEGNEAEDQLPLLDEILRAEADEDEDED